MANKCEVCDKKPITGHNVSHSNRKTIRRWEPNIQMAKLTINGITKKYKICTSCIKNQTKLLKTA